VVVLGADDIVIASTSFYSSPAATNDTVVRRLNPFADE
jgi:hypothetical protein